MFATHNISFAFLPNSPRAFVSIRLRLHLRPRPRLRLRSHQIDPATHQFSTIDFTSYSTPALLDPLCQLPVLQARRTRSRPSLDFGLTKVRVTSNWSPPRGLQSKALIEPLNRRVPLFHPLLHCASKPRLLHSFHPTSTTLPSDLLRWRIVRASSTHNGPPNTQQPERG